MEKNDDASTENKALLDLADEILNSTPAPTGKPTVHAGPAQVKKTTLTASQMQALVQKGDLTHKKYYGDPMKWIERFNQVHDIEFTYRNESVLRAGSKIDLNTYKAFIRTSVKELDLTKHLNKQVVDDMVTLWMSQEKTTFLEQTRQRLLECGRRSEHD